MNRPRFAIIHRKHAEQRAPASCGALWQWVGIAILFHLRFISPCPAAQEPAMVERAIAGPESAAKWQAAECSLESSVDHSRNGKPLLHWHVTVDYTKGEPKHLIGWPRITLPIKEPAARDWSGWEYLQMWIYADTSRASLPASEPAALTFQAPDNAHGTHYVLTELAKGKWAQVRIPLAQISGLEDVRMLQFNISESRYHHLDQVDFYIDDLALARYAQPTILQFAPECQMTYSDVAYIPVRFDLGGVRTGQTAEVMCEVLRDGHVMATASAQCARGANRIAIDVSKAKLGEGDYQLQARIGLTGPIAEQRIRLVKSPWQSAE